jgi:signal transduction histidine kinase
MAGQARQIAGADNEHARLLQAEQQQSRRLALLAEVARIVATNLDAGGLLQDVAESIRRHFAYPVVGLFTLDDDGQALTLRGYSGVSVGPPELTRPGVYRQSIESGIVGTVARTGRSHLAPDVAVDPYYHKSGDQVAIRSEVCVPIFEGGRVIGVLDVESDRLADFNEQDQSLLEAVADTVSIGLRNARLYEESQVRASALAVTLARLAELDHLKDEFIQNVSHELRSPLAIIRGYVEMLESGELGELRPEQRKPVTIIARRTRMLSDMVRNITLILEAEVSPPPPEPVPMGELAQMAIEDFQVVADQAGLTLHAQIAPNLPPVSGSWPYLRRLLDNLLDNAIKFTPAGGVITLQIQQKGAQVALQVSDTGVGIPPDQLERIFERFYQVNGSIWRRYGGMGLGLALVREIARTYGGQVSVESQVGEGSTFTVLLPVAGDTLQTKGYPHGT